MNNPKATVATDLRALMLALGLTRAEVADRLGITPAALSQQLNGRRNLTLETIGAIADTMGYDFAVIFRRKGP